MTYQQAGRIAILKRVAGWVIFLLALLSTVISVLSFMFKHSEKQPGIDAVMLDFVHVMIDMVRFNTPFLGFFWHNSPVPEFNGQMNIGFWLIYILIFVGLALEASGARMARQARHIKEGIEDQMILEQTKGSEGRSRQQLEEKVRVPRHTIFLQIFPLYILPIVIAVVGYFVLSLLGLV
ncbi:MAG: YniB family protein [Enterobacterales bacterium endosymbiont of Blomia tropicalis]|uniref:YniB family protein n=1 Tax=Mixta mediterraneensis TaxID=2758443 RepID=UPI001876BA03|nr:YniB family protein [Mixta mediterraneensis]MBE5251478.1 YniB family protein [Mixta mediterraneensis]MDL4913910.1 YniB family protein [Mixta mediterraneensis]